MAAAAALVTIHTCCSFFLFVAFCIDTDRHTTHTLAPIHQHTRLRSAAHSDNVVRAGLTPKFKDVDTLVSMLTYSQGGPSIDAGAPLESDARILRYTPPVPEFEVLIMRCEPGDSIELDVGDTPCVFVIIEGTGFFDGTIICRPGRSYYHPAEAPPIRFHVPKEKRGPLKVAVAHENLHLDLPTTYRKPSMALPPTPFVSPAFFKKGGSSDDDLKNLSVNEYDYEM